jgi:hypothetical protein
MTHPEELLAGYVDGTLSPKERRAVDSHVADCSRCSREISLAAGARSALRSLMEVPAPPGIATRALEEAGGARRSAASGTPRWYRIGGAAAAVAAGLLVLTLVLPNIGQSESPGGEAARVKDQGAAGDARESTSTLLAAIEIQQVNYDDASLTALISWYQSDASSGGALSAAAPTSQDFGTQAQTDRALACVAQSAPDPSGELQNLIRARFQGTPAYLAVFLEGPGAGQPADTATAWVFATKDCRILSFSSAQL